MNYSKVKSEATGRTFIVPEDQSVTPLINSTSFEGVILFPNITRVESLNMGQE